MALGRNYFRDRLWQDPNIKVSATGGRDPVSGRLTADYGLWEGLMARVYGMDPQKQANLALEHRLDKGAEKHAKDKYGLTPGDLLKVGVDINDPNNTIDQINTAASKFAKLKKNEAKGEVETQRKIERGELIADRKTAREDRRAEQALLSKERQLEAQQANLQQLKILGMQNQASENQWMRQMQYMDKKEEAKQEEAQLEALVAGLASLGANLI